MEAVIIDTETNDKNEPEVIEVAYAEIILSSLEFGARYREMFQPSRPITFGAMATHHIVPEDLEGCRPSCDFRLPPEVEYIIGHNIDFDWQAIGSPHVKRICTLALARKIWPDTDSHSLSALLYMIHGSVMRGAIAGAHSAVADVNLCRELLFTICDNLKPKNLDDLWRMSEEARIPTIMPFGKHKGMAIKDVPKDYISWLLKQDDVDPYLRQALEGTGEQGRLFA